MSCISKILEIKGDKEFLKVPDIDVVIEHGGKYKDYEYLIVFNGNGFRCGYVALTETHPTYTHANTFPDFDVHGGVTFFDYPHLIDIFLPHPCTDKWIGFDCGHLGVGGDLSDLQLIKKYFNGLCHQVEFMEKMELYNPKLKSLEFNIRSIKSIEYVENECKKLIDQLIEKAA